MHVRSSLYIQHCWCVSPGQIPTLIMATNLHIIGQPPGARAVATPTWIRPSDYARAVSATTNRPSQYGHRIGPKPLLVWRHWHVWRHRRLAVHRRARLSLTSYARRVLEINGNILDRQRSYRATPKRLMAAVKHRCFLTTNGNTLNYLTYDFSLRQYLIITVSPRERFSPPTVEHSL